eukprot:CAMPEP_0185745638 /NCGR_PEP_ID=MMETSP1174-20130828/4042_1 /TAXON_ID=35687 /ORGANISM="Dictyocha speculum, Strain CCMP1381" /LENGTH=183 /DNA_ID=CAMNT_0028419793 /DNA_START=128 /DNA_END=679 /DNA_ORIENTATION=+
MASGFVPLPPLAATAIRRKSSSSSLRMTNDPNPVIKILSGGMGLIKPVFAAEAGIQAAALGAVGGVSEEDVAAEIEAAKSSSEVLIYTYALSPFSTEALGLLDSTGYEYTKIELGLEWFTLGPNGSQTRKVLGSMCENGATSLPKIFIGGQPLRGASGYSALAEVIENGELENLLKSSGAKQI